MFRSMVFADSDNIPYDASDSTLQYYAYSGRPNYVIRIYDTDFESNPYFSANIDHVGVRVMIHEYTNRGLNVISNLKLYFSNKLAYMTFDDALYELNTIRGNLSFNYPHLNFNDHYPCLRKHLDRMLFVRKLKS